MKVQIIHAGDFVKATPKGEVNLELSKARIAKLVDALDPIHKYNFLVDWRNVTINFSVTDLYYLASEIFRYNALSRARISLLLQPEDFDKGDFLQLCSRNKCIYLSAFTDYEDAINWLTIETQLELK